MIKKNYKFGTTKCYSYWKKVGHGYESGFMYGPKPVFVGNFLTAVEARTWYAKLNKELSTFTKRFWVGKNVPKQWYGQFVANHLYKSYYNYLDRLFGHKTKTYKNHATRDLRKYRELKKEWTPQERVPFKLAA